jgi:hypothetical protein
MTGAARRDVASICLRAWRVTAKTRDVSTQSRWYRQSNTTKGSPVTSATSSARVFRVIEPRVKAAQRGKRLHFSALSVRVTDRTDLAGGICKLLCVTAGARSMCSLTGQRWLRRIILATMAKQTGKPSVIAIVVFEL